MNFKNRYRRYLIKWGSWEYWPPSISNIPVVLFWIWFALRSRSLLFFTNVNPTIPTGGLFGESKASILRQLPQKHLPPFVLIKDPASCSREELLSKLSSEHIGFPLIVKPDVGERGRGVKKVDSEIELLQYHSRQPVDYLIQEYIDLPLEFSILCYRMPGSEEGEVTSVCSKVFLHVEGDGSSTLESLIRQKPRSALQFERLRPLLEEKLKEVPPKGKVIQLEPIGNHCRGTKFINRNDLIDDRLSSVFTGMLKRMQGVHYGRFDLRANSIENLKTGNGFRIMEFNGIGSEPAHVYDPGYPVKRAYGDFLRHWKIIYHIHKEQRKRGVDTMKLSGLGGSWRAYQRSVKASSQGINPSLL